jgi:calpain-15
MEWKDFLKYYSDLQICYFHDGFKYSAVSLTSEKNKKVVLRFHLEEEGKYYFSVN